MIFEILDWSHRFLKCWSGTGAGASHFKDAGAKPEQEPVIVLMHSWS